MTRLFTSILLLVLLTGIPATLFAQSNINEVSSVSKQLSQKGLKYEINIVAFRSQNRVYLRWLLNNALQWKNANEQGYNIERAESGSEKYIILNARPIKPISNEMLKKYDKASEIFKIKAIMSQKSDNKPESLAKQQSLYSIYFLLSSYNFSNAQLTASGWIDSTVQSGKSYTYRVSVAGVSSINQKSTTYSVPGADNKLVDCPELNGDFIKKSVKLNWDNKKILEDYFAIQLEKSTDSIHFKSVTKYPLLTKIENTLLKDDSTKTTTFFTDTAVILNTKYYYRIVGKNIFGLESKPSNIISGIITLDLNVAPEIQMLDTLKGKYILTWIMPASQNALVSKYQVLHSKTGETGTYKLLREVKGGKELVAAFDFKPSNSNYFVVKAIGFKRNEEVPSAPYFHQMVDSIPPNAPKGLTGSIDKKGVVRLKWNKNTDEDIRGYRILKKLNNAKEFALMSAKIIKDTFLVDTLPLNQLKLDAYYCITALDNHFNISAHSDSIVLVAPDTIPPAPPRILEVESLENEQGNRINWVKSFSKDVKKYVLYRKDLNETSLVWNKISEPSFQDTSYFDKSINPKHEYIYKITAVDKGDLMSAFSDSVQTYVPKQINVDANVFTRINAYVASDYNYIELSWWTKNAENVKEYWIYKTSNRTKDQFSLIANVPAITKRFVDKNITKKTIYTYYIKAVFKSGKSSDFEQIEARF